MATGLTYAFTLVIVLSHLPFAFAGSLCVAPPSDNKCSGGVGQFKGDPCMTLRAFQTVGDPDARDHSMDYASMSRFVEDPKQWVGIHNSCCTGLMQLNYVNLNNPDICGCTAQEFAAYSQQQQIDRVTKMTGKSLRPGVYNCKDCRKPFSVTVGTIMERSHIPLSKWVVNQRRSGTRNQRPIETHTGG
jgi:hypothetical protein